MKKEYKRLTIYSSITPLPKSKEKQEEAKKAIIGETVDIRTEETLVKMLTEFAYSPAVFEGKRCKDNFLYTDFIVLDIDSEQTIKGVAGILKALKLLAYIGTTTSHQKEKSDIKCDRFRIILPLYTRINEVKDFFATYDYLGKYIKFDKQCRDAARFYFACKCLAKIDGVPLRVREGIDLKLNKNKVIPIEGEKGELNLRTKTFLDTGKGAWHDEFLFACRDLKAQQYTKEEAESLLTEITGYLDDNHDNKQLDYVYKDDTVVFDFRRKDVK